MFETINSQSRRKRADEKKGSISDCYDSDSGLSAVSIIMTPLLIDIARKSPSNQIRKQAADALGAVEALRETTGDPDKRIRNAASDVLLSLSDETPFILEIKMDRAVYPYGALVNMKYKITNVSSHTITLRLYRKDRSLIVDGVGFGVPEIRKLDGTSPKYVGPRPGGGRR